MGRVTNYTIENVEILSIAFELVQTVESEEFFTNKRTSS